MSAHTELMFKVNLIVLTGYSLLAANCPQRRDHRAFRYWKQTHSSYIAARLLQVKSALHVASSNSYHVVFSFVCFCLEDLHTTLTHDITCTLYYVCHLLYQVLNSWWSQILSITMWITCSRSCMNCTQIMH